MIRIREIQPTDSIGKLTELLHRAYAPLAAAGMRFLATHQDEATTTRRIGEGVCFVAEADEGIVGTIVYCPPGSAKGCDWYERDGVACFQQFAVEPSLQRTGIGAMLLSHVECRARQDGAAELALDTSECATHLIRYYKSRGYREVGQTQWDVTNYRSIILSKTL